MRFEERKRIEKKMRLEERKRIEERMRFEERKRIEEKRRSEEKKSFEESLSTNSDDYEDIDWLFATDSESETESDTGYVLLSS